MTRGLAVLCQKPLAPTYALFALALVPVGLSALTALTTANAMVQLSVDPAMRGRVMSLWTIAFLGTTPVGGPIIDALLKPVSDIFQAYFNKQITEAQLREQVQALMLTTFQAVETSHADTLAKTYATFWAAVRWGNKAKSWKTRPIRDLSDASLTSRRSRSSNRIRP